MCQITFRRANKGLRGSTLTRFALCRGPLGWLYLFVLHVPRHRPSRRTNRQKTSKIGWRSRFHKDTRGKKLFIGSDDLAVYVLSPFPEYLSHKVWFNNCAAVCSVFFLLKLYQTSTICSSIWVYRFLWPCDYSIKSNHDAKTACRW